MKQLLAENRVMDNLPTLGVEGPFDTSDPLKTFSSILGGFFQLLLLGAGLWALFQFILAGYSMITSGGDKAALEKARSKLMWALIGLIVVAASWGLILFAQNVLDICLGFGDCTIDIAPE